MLVFPALVDPHVHLRSLDKKYSKITASDVINDALAGGYRAIGSMPNTVPIADSLEFFEEFHLRSKENLCEVIQYAAATNSLLGASINKRLEALKERFSVQYISNDGLPLPDNNLIKQIIKKAKELDMIFSVHCEEMGIEKEYDSRLAAYEKARISESIALSRLLIIASELSANYKIHLCHISTTGSLELIKCFRDKLHFTIEVTPHHLCCSRDDIAKLESPSLMKCNPPILEEKDREALLEALILGEIEMIATDHAPHKTETKLCSWERANYGVIGLRTSFGTVLQLLKDRCGFEESLKILYRAMVDAPGKLLKIENLEILEGNEVNFFLFKEGDRDSDQETNCFFADNGVAVHLFLNGKKIY
jgi:dihydroorotase